MDGWQIGNRYWADEAFSAEATQRYRDHARRTCVAAELGV